MKILIMGGAGMIGQKLLNLLLKKEKLNNQKISEITLFDIMEAPILIILIFRYNQSQVIFRIKMSVKILFHLSQI